MKTDRIDASFVHIFQCVQVEQSRVACLVICNEQKHRDASADYKCNKSLWLRTPDTVIR